MCWRAPQNRFSASEMGWRPLSPHRCRNKPSRKLGLSASTWHRMCSGSTARPRTGRSCSATCCRDRKSSFSWRTIRSASSRWNPVAVRTIARAQKAAMAGWVRRESAHGSLASPISATIRGTVCANVKSADLATRAILSTASGHEVCDCTILAELRGAQRGERFQQRLPLRVELIDRFDGTGCPARAL